MNIPTDADLQKWHRFFAVEANNSAWQRTLDSDEERSAYDILMMAYVSAYHWSQCGTDSNAFRANILLAHAHAFCGHGRTALEYVSRYTAYLQEHEVETWEKPFAAMIHAQAAWVAGDVDLHAKTYAEAAALVEGINDPGDREVVELTWVNIPRP